MERRLAHQPGCSPARVSAAWRGRSPIGAPLRYFYIPAFIGESHPPTSGPKRPESRRRRTATRNRALLHFQESLMKAPFGEQGSCYVEHDEKAVKHDATESFAQVLWKLWKRQSKRLGLLNLFCTGVATRSRT